MQPLPSADAEQEWPQPRSLRAGPGIVSWSRKVRYAFHLAYHEPNPLTDPSFTQHPRAEDLPSLPPSLPTWTCLAWTWPPLGATAPRATRTQVGAAPHPPPAPQPPQGACTGALYFWGEGACTSTLDTGTNTVQGLTPWQEWRIMAVVADMATE